MSPESDLPWYIGLIVSWLPFIVFCLVGWQIARHVRKGLTTKDGRSVADVLEDLSRELKQSNVSKP